MEKYLVDTFKHKHPEELETKPSTLTTMPVEFREGHEIMVI